MSRYYEMTVKVTGFDPIRCQDIKTAANAEWGFEDWSDAPKTEHSDADLLATGRDSLCGGEAEDEFAERLARAIWNANGGYCLVEVTATFLEDLPSETYLMDEEKYEALVHGKENEASLSSSS